MSAAGILRDTVTTTFPFKVCPASIAEGRRRGNTNQDIEEDPILVR